MKGNIVLGSSHVKIMIFNPYGDTLAQLVPEVEPLIRGREV
jgi:hypothetical protein